MTQADQRAEAFQPLPPASHHTNTMRAAIYSYGDRWTRNAMGTIDHWTSVVESWTGDDPEIVLQVPQW